jgi:tetratricopeptide (TPR) repeat protein
MRLKILILFLMLSSVFAVSTDFQWGTLKKIDFYISLKQHDAILKELKQLDLHAVPEPELPEMLSILQTMADSFYSQKEYTLAERFYLKIMDASSKHWYLYNNIEKIRKIKGSHVVHMKNILKQQLLIKNDFGSSVLLTISTINSFFISAFLVFFIFSLILLIKYFKLTANDLLINDANTISGKKLILLAVFLLWPILLLTGWIVYPFLILGIVWTYISESEKRTVFSGMVVLFIAVILFSFSAILAKNLENNDFKKVMRIYKGDTFEKKEYLQFDNELKTLLALANFEKNDLKNTEEILKTIPENYANPLKHDLWGNIFFYQEKIEESLSHYRLSLNMNTKNPVTLNNFTLALLKNNNEKSLNHSANAFPEIKTLKDKVLTILTPKRPESFLWKRLLSFSQENMSVSSLLWHLLLEFIKNPFIYAFLIFFVYLFLIRRFFQSIGSSTHCSKCSKIIKESSAHRSYRLCEECYQLFLIKDVIFLEAKNIKEKELQKRHHKKKLFQLAISLVVPGIRLKYRNQNQFFYLFGFLFYFLLFFTIINSIAFLKVFSAQPIFLILTGIAAFLLYLGINIISIKGDEDGI